MKMKKLLSVILAAVMLLGCMSVTAFAADDDYCTACEGTGNDSKAQELLAAMEGAFETIAEEYNKIEESGLDAFENAVREQASIMGGAIRNYGRQEWFNHNVVNCANSVRDRTDFILNAASNASVWDYEEVTYYYEDMQYCLGELRNEVNDARCQPCEGTGEAFMIDDGVLIRYNGKGGNVVIPNGVTAIGERAFENCGNLTGVTIPSGVKSIGDYAFVNCNYLAEVTIPSGVESIGRSAFDCCVMLTEVTIPSSVTSIGDSAFGTCYGLTDVTLSWTDAADIPQKPQNIFINIVPDVTVHIPDGMTAAYAAKGWVEAPAPEEPEGPTTLSTFTLSKDYTDTYTSEASTKVSETINFTIAPIGGAPAFANSGAVSMTVTSGVGSAEITLPTDFNATGDFWYTITESAGSIAGVTYNTTPCYLHLVVYKIDGAYKVVSAAIHEAAPVNGVYSEEDKITSVTNSYAEGTLVIKQEATIDGTDSDDVFTEEVTFTLPEGTTIIGNITYTDSEGEHTITPDDWEDDGTVTVDVKIKGGETVTFEGIPDGTTYEVTQTDSNPELGFGDPDYDITKGEDGEDVVVTDSGKETKVTGKISDGEDDITIKNESTTPIDVGVILENGAFIVLALGALIAAAWLIISKRRKSLDAE